MGSELKTKGPEVRGLSQYGKTTIILSPPSVRFVANRTGSQLLLVLVALLALSGKHLPTDLAPRIVRYGMDIRIGRIGFERSHQCVEIARCNILQRDRLDVILVPRPGDCSAIRGTGLWSRPRPGKRQVRAEEHKDAAGIAGLTKMNVSLRHRARLRRRGSDVRVGQREGYRAGHFIQNKVCRTRAVGQYRSGVGGGCCDTQSGDRHCSRYRSDFVDPL